jgi:hypothetical protein
VYLFATGSNVLQQVSSGTVAGYPSANLYETSQLVSSVTNPLARWVDQNSFGLSLGTPALNQAGNITLLMPEVTTAALGPTTLQLTLSVGNSGQLDPDFAGYDIQVSVEAPGFAAVSVPALLLPDLIGYNSQGTQIVNIPIPSGLTGPWLLKISWSNDRSVPRRGWQRALVLYGVTVRTLERRLYQVQVNPFTITRIPVDIPQPSLQAGAWVGYITNSGSVYPSKHETEFFSVPADNPFGYPLVPASDALTSSSAARFDDLRSVGSFLRPNTPPIAPPIINGVTISPTPPAGGYYQVGQSLALTANVTASQPRFVWSLWSGGTTATENPTITAPLIAGGSQTAFLQAVDQLGQTGSWTGSIFVNNPPLISAAGAFPNDQVGPYLTTLMAYVSDAENSPVNTGWYANGSLFATGTQIPGYFVEQSGYIDVVCTDTMGGTSTLPVYLAVEPPNPPSVAIAGYTTESRTNFPVTLSFAAIGADPQQSVVTPSWTFWDGAVLPGYVASLEDFGSGSLYTVQRTMTVPTVGYYPFSLTLTDTLGLTSTVGAGVQFDVNHPPELVSITVSDPAVSSGTPVYIAANAVDPDGDPLTYVWTFAGVPTTLYGPNVTLQTAGLAPGTVITPTVQISDGYGGILNIQAPSITVYAAGLNALVASIAGGIFYVGITLQISGEAAGSQIVYTLDGTDPTSVSSGTPYAGLISLPYAPGTTVTVNARAFLAGYAPSPLLTATYQFLAIASS